MSCNYKEIDNFPFFKYDFLREVTSVIDVTHNKKDFYWHLVRTSKITEVLCPENDYLINAALYHSIYETCYFIHNKLHPLITRDNIKKIIGERAERLVFLFCNLTDRTEIIISNYFKDDLQKDLYILELANYIENFPISFETHSDVIILLEKLKSEYNFIVNLDKIRLLLDQ
jgi:hypothetical protein